MWEVGSFAFVFGYTVPYTYGCHKVGGNTLYTDGSAAWRNYLWVTP